MLSGSSDVTRAIGFKQVLVNANPLVANAMLEKVVPANGMHQPPGISASPPLLRSFGIVQHVFIISLTPVLECKHHAEHKHDPFFNRE